MTSWLEAAGRLMAAFHWNLSRASARAAPSVLCFERGKGTQRSPDPSVFLPALHLSSPAVSVHPLMLPPSGDTRCSPCELSCSLLSSPRGSLDFQQHDPACCCWLPLCSSHGVVHPLQVNYKNVMKQYSLGPNGGILTSLNLFATRFDQVGQHRLQPRLNLREPSDQGVTAGTSSLPAQQC